MSAAHPPDCAWCPLCRLAGALRVQPEAMAAVLAAAGTFLDALRDLLERDPAPAESAEPRDPADPPAPRRLQRIDLGTGE